MTDLCYNCGNCHLPEPCPADLKQCSLCNQLGHTFNFCHRGVSTRDPSYRFFALCHNCDNWHLPAPCAQQAVFCAECNQFGHMPRYCAVRPAPRIVSQSDQLDTQDRDAPSAKRKRSIGAAVDTPQSQLDLGHTSSSSDNVQRGPLLPPVETHMIKMETVNFVLDLIKQGYSMDDIFRTVEHHSYVMMNYAQVPPQSQPPKSTLQQALAQPFNQVSQGSTPIRSQQAVYNANASQEQGYAQGRLPARSLAVHKADRADSGDARVAIASFRAPSRELDGLAASSGNPPQGHTHLPDSTTSSIGQEQTSHQAHGQKQLFVSATDGGGDFASDTNNGKNIEGPLMMTDAERFPHLTASFNAFEGEDSKVITGIPSSSSVATGIATTLPPAVGSVVQSTEDPSKPTAFEPTSSPTVSLPRNNATGPMYVAPQAIPPQHGTEVKAPIKKKAAARPRKSRAKAAPAPTEAGNNQPHL